MTTDERIMEMHTDMKWVKDALRNKANKWVERVVGIFMLGATGYVIKQVAGLLPVVKAFMD